MSFQGSKAVIFGGSSGIGLATAQALLAQGAEVTIVARNPAKLAEAAKQLEGAVHTEALDGSDRGAVDAFFRDCGELDHLILTVGGGVPPTPFAEIDLDAFRAGFDAKFWAQFSIAQRAAGQIRPGGSLTFIGGAASRRGLPGMVQYAAINGALDAIVRPLARELAPVRVNVVSPGTVDTPFWGGMPDEARQGVFNRMASALPAGRVGRPEDIAQAVLYAAGNGYVTGTIVDVEGGLLQAAL